MSRTPRELAALTYHTSMQAYKLIVSNRRPKFFNENHRQTESRKVLARSRVGISMKNPRLISSSLLYIIPDAKCDRDVDVDVDVGYRNLRWV